MCEAWTAIYSKRSARKYVARPFAADSKQRVLKLVHALEAALSNDIQQVDWMSPSTKKAALAKLEKIADKSDIRIIGAIIRACGSFAVMP